MSSFVELKAVDVHTGNCVYVKQVDSIDLSNTCRAFYQSWLESTRKLKDKWQETGELEKGYATYGEGCIKDESNIYRDGAIGSGAACKNTPQTSLNVAICTLRKEMAALFDQDLCLMKQLLTLNEEIEDLKWSRLHVWNKTSSYYCSDMIESAASLERDDHLQSALVYPTPSSLSLQLEGPRLSVYNDDDPYATFNRPHVKSKERQSIIEGSRSSLGPSSTTDTIYTSS